MDPALTGAAGPLADTAASWKQDSVPLTVERDWPMILGRRGKSGEALRAFEHKELYQLSMITGVFSAPGRLLAAHGNAVGLIRYKTLS
jgi:hypothetical protein